MKIKLLDRLRFDRSYLISGFFLISSALIGVYAFYISEIVNIGTNRNAYLKYYFISIIGCFVWILVLNAKRLLRENINTVAIACIIGMYFFELLFFLTPLGNLAHPDARARAAFKNGIAYDTRTNREVIQDLVDAGVDAVPVVFPIDLLKEQQFQNFLPLSGVSKKTTVYNNENGSYLIYDSDRYGFNNPDEQWDVTDIDLLLIGDSFVHGSAVMRGEDIAGQLRELTNNNVINIGVGGHGPLLEYATFLEYGKDLKAREVMWFYYEGNDLLNDLSDEKQSKILRRYLDENFTQGLVQSQRKIDTMLGEYISVKTEIYDKSVSLDLLDEWAPWLELPIVRRLISIDKRFSKTDEQTPHIDDPIFQKILQNVNSYVKSTGGKMIFVYLPQYERYIDDNIDHGKFKSKDYVLGIVKNLGIPTLDMHELVFTPADDPLKFFPFRLSGHYNADGYKKISEIITNNISSKLN